MMTRNKESRGSVSTKATKRRLQDRIHLFLMLLIVFFPSIAACTLFAQYEQEILLFGLFITVFAIVWFGRGLIEQRRSRRANDIDFDRLFNVAAPKSTALDCMDVGASREHGGQLLFELHGPGGEKWMLYLDGSSEGFPPGTVIVNHASPLVNAMIGKMKKHGSYSIG